MMKSVNLKTIFKSEKKQSIRRYVNKLFELERIKRYQLKKMNRTKRLWKENYALFKTFLQEKIYKEAVYDLKKKSTKII
jgi:hypothetical protein